MSEEINPLVVDLSHWDPADDYQAAKDAGIVGVIYKATEGTSYHDPTYRDQCANAGDVGLRWGAYHFADGSSVAKQIDNFLLYAKISPDELFCLDWEDNGGDVMSLANVKTWMAEVENALDREGQCVLYGGNTIKEALGNNDVDGFLRERRLWLCQYGSTPEWPATWDSYWLWQFTDGQYGPQPHTVPGIGPCDINSYAGTAEQLIAEWASGSAQRPSAPVEAVVTITIDAPPGVTVKVQGV